MTGLYVLGILFGILVALLYKKVLFKGEAVPFVMELPNYRIPTAKNVMHLLWVKAKDFIQKAFSVILIATIIIWFLQSFDMKFNLVENQADSILAMISGWLVPIFKPIGLGDWRICTSLISGVVAKESVVSVMEMLFASVGGVAAVLAIPNVLSLLVFSLLYTPCIAAVTSVKRELGKRWALFVVLWQCFVAWCAAGIVNLLCRLIMKG